MSDHDDHAHDDHDDHGHPPEDPKWVLLPLVVGFVIGAVLIAIFGIQSSAPAFT